MRLLRRTGVNCLEKKRIIGICLGRIQEYFQNDIVHSIIRSAHDKNCKVLIFNAFSDFYMNDAYDAGEKHVFDLIDYDRLDGLIVMGESIHNDELRNGIIENARRKNVYTVCIDKHTEGCYNISFNYRTAFEAMVEHIISVHGCKVINLVAGMKNNAFSDERIDCCREIMKKHGLELDERRIMYGDFWADPTSRAFDEFMQSGLSLPDVFICCNDSMAITICSKLKECGLAVPGDVLVTGFDGILEEKYHIPRLTTAKQDVELAGQKAVEAIAAHLEGWNPGDGCVIDHKVQLAHSCGCKKIDYREATGQISPLFKLADGDNTYDSYMHDLSNAASDAENLDILGDKIIYHSAMFGYYYFGVCMNEDYSNMSEDYESLISGVSPRVSDGRKLILCERLIGNDYSPVYSDGFVHLEEALEELDVFLFWSIHFRGKIAGHGVMGLSTGLDGRVPNDDIRHLLKYTRNLNHVLELYNSKAVMKKVINRLNELYVHDHTGLFNRRGFYGEINRQISEALNSGEDRYLIIASVDLDGLKYINDTFGHAEGDVAIKTVADALISIWGEHEVCSRFGGDEFTVASICGCDPEACGNELVDRIKAFMESFNASSGKPYKVEASFGIHWDKLDENTKIDTIIKAADDKMYVDKSEHHTRRSRNTSR